MLGLSPTLVRALIPTGVPEADLSSLRAVTTTGEPWNAGPYDWLNEHVAGDGRIPIVNISGGTEVGACFLSVTPMAPDEAGLARLSRARAAIDVYSPDGTPLRGEVGELVCTKRVAGDDARHLGRRRALPRDRTGAASRASGRTATGPRSTRTATGSCTAAPTTRSTSRASGSARPSSSRRRSSTRRSRRRRRSASRTRSRARRRGSSARSSPAPRRTPTRSGRRSRPRSARRSRPERVLFVSALPKTRSAKIVRRAVRAKALGEDPGDLSTLENPDVLEEIAHV